MIPLPAVRVRSILIASCLGFVCPGCGGVPATGTEEGPDKASLVQLQNDETSRSSSVIYSANAASILDEKAAVYSACGADGAESSTTRKGVLASVELTKLDGIRVEWDDGTTSSHRVCDTKLYTSLDHATSAGCEVTRPAPIYRSHPDSGSKLEGFVDTHVHMMAEFGFGGRLLYPSAFDSGDKLEACDGSSFHGSSDDNLNGGGLDLALKMVQSCDGAKLPTHPEKTHPYDDWPRWNDLGHHQVLISWVRKAWDSGLRVIVVSAVNNEELCDLADLAGIPPMNGVSGDCDDATNLRAQIDAVHKMADQESSWMEIALSSSDARRIVKAGKLAVVIHLESSFSLLHGFDDDVLAESASEEAMVKVKENLQMYHKLGVRSIQILHEYNNVFGGAAQYNPLLDQMTDLLMYLKSLNEIGLWLGHDPSDSSVMKQFTEAQAGTGKIVSGVKNTKYSEALDELVRKSTSSEADNQCRDHLQALVAKADKILKSKKHYTTRTETGPGLTVMGESTQHNTRSLTAAGERVLREMMQMGLLVDAAHFGRSTFRRFAEVAAQESYPVFISHASLAIQARDMGDYGVDAEVIEAVARTGGMVGLRTRDLISPTWIHSKVKNDCPGSSKSFAQVLEAVRDTGVTFGLSTDFNGHATNLSPRFGKESETCTAEWREAGCSHRPDGVQCDHLQASAKQYAQEQKGTETGSRFDKVGFASVEYFGAVLDELDAVGSSTSDVRHSAQSFIEMWERAEKKGKAQSFIEASEATTKPLSAEELGQYLKCGFDSHGWKEKEKATGIDGQNTKASRTSKTDARTDKTTRLIE